jgi:hypothetical protein
MARPQPVPRKHFGRSGRCDCAKQAWERRKGCNEYTPETFRRDPAGGTPAQKRLTNGWKRVLRRSKATRPAKRRQRVRKPCYGAPKDLSRESLLFTYQGPRRGTVSVRCPRSCRRRLNRANGQSGFPRNLGVSYAANRGSPSTRNRSSAYLEPRRCECRLDRLMVSRLLASPPAWEYEPGSCTASSLVTPGPRRMRWARVRVVLV